MYLPQGKNMVNAGVWVKRVHTTICEITAVQEPTRSSSYPYITPGFEFSFENWRGAETGLAQ